MKVKELIERLEQLDGDLNVYICGYEGGFDDLVDVSGVFNVALNINKNTWYMGAHEIIYDSEEDRYKDAEKSKGIVL